MTTSAQLHIPRLLIGGTRSGEGKTTVALGVMAALRARGLAVQGFKVGPDYLDTGYQLLATGRVGRNLDLWMMGEAAVRESVLRHGGAADVTVIEGVMGLFDGHRDGVTPTSSADVAKRLDAPVILVMDAAHLAASAGAVALGFRTFDPDVRVVGTILNRWNPHRSRVAVEAALARAGVPVLGYLPAAAEIALPSRHLGLVVADEFRDEAAAALANLAALIAAHVDIDRLLEIAYDTAAITVLPSPVTGRYGGGAGGGGRSQASGEGRKPRIAVARDDAFAFYYPENLELLEAVAEVVYFSPLADNALPEVDGLYLGGGYPELHAARLAENAGLRADLAARIAGGLPTYAECGGLMFLCATLTDVEGRTWPMVGAVPRAVVMHPRLQRMGYREGVLTRDSLLGPAGTPLRGHEFHYSSCAPEDAADAAYTLDGRPEGYARGTLFASYQHLHFTGCPEVVERLVRAAEVYRNR